MSASALSDTDVLSREVRQINPRVDAEPPIPGGGPGRWIESCWPASVFLACSRIWSRNGPETSAFGSLLAQPNGM